jgi:hypothetical protein
MVQKRFRISDTPRSKSFHRAGFHSSLSATSLLLRSFIFRSRFASGSILLAIWQRFLIALMTLRHVGFALNHALLLAFRFGSVVVASPFDISFSLQ